jgi:hypothetical protein
MLGDMKRSLLALTIAVCAGSPLIALAQPGPGSDDMGPPPAVRAKMDAIGAQAKAASYAVLTPEHRAAVDAILAKVRAGTLEPRAAGTQIDALLTPEETKAVMDVAVETREQARAAFGRAMPPPPPDGGPPNGGPPGGGPPGGEAHHRKMTAGGFLLRVSFTPEQMRALRGGPPPAPYQSSPPPTVK